MELLIEDDAELLTDDASELLAEESTELLTEDEAELETDDETELLAEDEVELTVELLTLRSSLNSVKPLGPPQISVELALQGMLQRMSVTGRDFAFSVSPQ